MSICAYFPACRGCDLWDQSYESQKILKLQNLNDLLNLSDMRPNAEKNFVSIKPMGLRHRFDFTFEIGQEQKMGFYDRDRNLLDLEICLQLSAELQNIFTLFRKIKINSGNTQIRKGSARLRVGPTGLYGIWLDLANVDIKSLLDDSVYLNQLLEAGFNIEMGQKAKRVRRLNGKLKLTDSEAAVWFQTQNYKLHSFISDFTQPSWLSANKLVEVVLNWCENKNIKSMIEFGPGIGQFTIPLLAKNIHVEAFENNSKAVEVLQLNAKLHDLEKNLVIHHGDYQKKSEAMTAPEFDLVLVNPPRSGLKNFVRTIIETQSRYCIYVSCFPESLKTDIVELQKAGYRITDTKIVDQFPQTTHYESCVLLEKI